MMPTVRKLTPEFKGFSGVFKNLSTGNFELLEN